MHPSVQILAVSRTQAPLEITYPIMQVRHSVAEQVLQTEGQSGSHTSLLSTVCRVMPGRQVRQLLEVQAVQPSGHLLQVEFVSTNPSEHEVQRVTSAGSQEPVHFLAHFTQLLLAVLRANPFLHSLQRLLSFVSETAQLY